MGFTLVSLGGHLVSLWDHLGSLGITGGSLGDHLEVTWCHFGVIRADKLAHCGFNIA